MPQVRWILARGSAQTHHDHEEIIMRRTFFWSGWGVLLALPIVYGVQIYLAQDLPSIAAWQWLIPTAAGLSIFFSRNPDDVLKHHIAH